MSRKATPIDNAAMESYFHTFKAEVIHGKKFKTQEELDSRYKKDQEKIAESIIDRENRRMAILPMNADRMERNADIRDRNTRADSRGAGSSTPD